MGAIDDIIQNGSDEIDKYNEEQKQKIEDKKTGQNQSAQAPDQS